MQLLLSAFILTENLLILSNTSDNLQAVKLERFPKLNLVSVLLHYSSRCIRDGSLCQTLFYFGSFLSSLQQRAAAFPLSFLFSLKVTVGFASPLPPFLSRLTAAVSSCQCRLCTLAPGGLPLSTSCRSPPSISVSLTRLYVAFFFFKKRAPAGWLAAKNKCFFGPPM